MKPLHVALIVKGSPATLERENRNMGYWSYPVPEFTWDHKHLGDGFHVPRRNFASYDLIFVEDGGNWGEFTGSGPAVVYHSIDSTLSDPHYICRFEQAGKSDLVLVDHDNLSRFRRCGKPVRRWAFCTNDHVFKPLEKTMDIAYHCSGGSRLGMPGAEARTDLRAYLNPVCAGKYSYRSGALGLLEYAASMGASRVVVNWPRTVINRPHRVFDAMACGCCLVTGPLPPVEEDYRQKGVHYLEFERKEEIPGMLDRLLAGGEWQGYAEAGRKLVMEHHTWAIRARELREMLNKELGL